MRRKRSRRKRKWRDCIAIKIIERMTNMRWWEQSELVQKQGKSRWKSRCKIRRRRRGIKRRR